MWKKVDGKLIHITDDTRVKFRTTISKSILSELEALAKENGSYVNYLIETGLQELLIQGDIIYDKKKRPKDRVHYKTTYNKELLQSVRDFAKEHNLFINDVIEYSIGLIDIDESKKSNHRYRIE